MSNEDTIKNLCQKCKFTEDETRFILIIYLDQSRLLENDKIFRDTFFEKQLGNAKFNEKVNALIKSGKDMKPKFIFGNKLSDISKIIYKSKEKSYFEKVLKKLSKIQELESTVQDVPDEMKLTIYDLSILNKMLELRVLLEGHSFAKESLPKISELVNSKKVSLYAEQFQGYFKSGDIIGHKLKYKKSILGKLLLDDRIKASFVDYGHLSLAVSKQKQAHMWGAGLTVDSINKRDVLFSDVFRVNIAKLVNEKLAQAMFQKYGENWEKTLQAKFEKQISLMSKRDIKFPSELTVVKNILKGLLPSFISANIYNPSNFSEADANKHEMICSEFVGETIYNACDQLNEELQKELGVTETVITNPVSKKRNLSELTTDGMIKMLQKSGAVEKVEHPLAKYVRSDKKYLSNFFRTAGEVDEVLVKFKKLLQKSASKEEFVTDAKNIFSSYLTDLDKEKLSRPEVVKAVDSRLSSLYNSKDRNIVLKILNAVEDAIKSVFGFTGEGKTIIECVSVIRNEHVDVIDEQLKNYQLKNNALKVAYNACNKDDESEIDKMSYSKLEFLYKLLLPNRIETDQDKMKSDISRHLKDSKLDSLQKITNAYSSLSKNFAAYSDSLSKSSKFIFQEKIDSLKRVFIFKQEKPKRMLVVAQKNKTSFPNSRNVATVSRKSNTSRGSRKTR